MGPAQIVWDIHLPFSRQANALPGAETNQGINVAADAGMTADEEAAQHMHN